LIIGASSGIGWQLARIFAQHGHPVALVARSSDKLEKLAQELQSAFQVRALTIAADLTQSDAPVQIAESLRARDVNVDMLVNNAGFGLRGRFAELDTRRQLDMIQLNVTAVTHLTRLFLPGMIQRNLGGVLNVASTAAFQSGPLMAVYYATKGFVLSFTEALHDEVAGTGLHVTCLCPGPTSTGFAATAGAENANLFKYGVDRADAVARRGYDAFQKNEVLAIPGIRNQMGVLAGKLAPRGVVRRIAMTLNQ
jgi:short-subunit dehydrogenase